MQGQTSRKIQREKLQRRLRSTPTDAEALLWRQLRGRQVEECKFRRQHPFLDFILDFACLERRVVIELDGGQHADSTAYDAWRTAALQDAGFTVLRFWNNDVFENTDGVLEVISRTLQARATPSPPKPSP